MIGLIFYGSSDARIGAHNPKTLRFASFLISIRDSVLALPSADRDSARIDAPGVKRPWLSSRAPFKESRGGVEGHAPNAALFGRTSSQRMVWSSGYAPLHSVPLRRAVGFEPRPRDLSSNLSQPFAMSGQLAGVISGVRIFFSRFISAFQNSPRERTKALGGISGVSRFASHDGHKSMRSLYEHPERADNWSGGNERAQ